MRIYLRYFPVLFAIFAVASVSPFVLCLFYFFYFYKKYEVSDEGLIGVVMLSAVVIGAINAVKVPDNDLEEYIYLYHLSKDMSLGQYIWVGSTAGGLESVKEPFYPVIVWILNKLCCDNEALFKFLFTVINYFLLNISVVIVGKKNNIDHLYILFGLFLMTFIPYIFTLSLQILRQFMAGALFMMILSLRCFSSVRIWKLGIVSFLMILVHSSSLFFVPFLFLKVFDKKWSDAKWLYIGILLFFVLIQVVSLLLVGALGGLDNSLGYALERASQDTQFESEGLGIVAVALLLIVICCSYHISVVSEIKDNPGIRRFFNVPLFLCFFVLINLRQKELALRMLFFSYPFVPIIAMIYSNLKSVRSGIITMVSIPVLLFFLVYMEFGVWTYEVPFSVFFTPLFCYFI